MATVQFPTYEVLKETIFSYLRAAPEVQVFNYADVYHYVEDEFNLNFRTHTNPLIHALQEIMDEYSVTIVYKSTTGVMRNLASLQQLAAMQNNRRRTRTE